ncbi:YbhB/YbcL family Raf kinase inhibitor-like protein [Saccharopolyspora erythraea]|uniref:YbhB/YbcL family Raf kinase inhibitor-like protein n=1 Tax=Saccharopolyspora erythraea TaxID=1836 RepID=UPI0001D3131A|nr:YbhB/YbcL family Raf kinase inhibitor-like protein [Saccharopolyspora erythraea]
MHWLVSAIPPSTRGLGGGAELPPDAVEHRNDFGRRGWDGPRPPAGDQPHRYFFRLYAVSRPLRLTAESTSDDLRDALHGAELAHGDLVGLYQR